MPSPNQQTFNPRVYGEAIKDRIINTDKLNANANSFDLELRENIAEHGKTPAVLKIASRAIAESMRLAEDAGERQQSPERYRFEAIAGMGRYVDNSIRLEMMNKAKVKREEKIPYLLEQAEFNHTLQNMLRSDPDTNLKDVERFLLNMYTLTERPATKPEIWDHKLNYAREHITVALEGARAELAGKDMIDSLARNPFIVGAMDIKFNPEVTPEQDINGIDGYVTFNGAEFPIDFKSSPKAVMGARHTSSHSASIVWSCTSPEDFINNGCRISEEDMATKHELMYQQLTQAYDSRYSKAA